MTPMMAPEGKRRGKTQTPVGHGSAFEAHGVPGLRATRLPAYRSRS